MGALLILKYIYNDEKCILCGSCVQESEAGGVKIENGKIIFDFSKLEDWSQIIQICPTGAIKVE